MGITEKLASLSPFGGSGNKERGDDGGDVMDPSSVAGGHDPSSGNPENLNVSLALRQFLADNNILSAADAGVGDEVNPPALKDMLVRSHIRVAPEVTDRSHPLTDYFISSSHNTYLLAHQLFGSSCSSGYELALGTGARCVEIDAWDNPDNKDEPKVTHGYTLVSNVSFRSVCETIRTVVDAERDRRASSPSPSHYPPAPVFLSLENHCGPHGQQRLVDIMNEVWGDRLLSRAITARANAEEVADAGVHVRLDELGSKICVMVEYHFDGEKEEEEDNSSSDSDSSDECSDADKAKHAADASQYKAEKKKAAANAKIIPALAAMGVYAQSVKPPDNSWFESALANAPHHHLINVSESGLSAHLPAASRKIAAHNAKHLMRVYPKGTRIGSSNLKPTPYWGVGAQVCALNWQRFGAGMQLNAAMFSGTDGFVLKPAYLRGNPPPPPPQGKKRLRLRVAGASDAPEATAPYVSCVLVHPDDLRDEPPKRKTGKDRKENINPMWDEVLEWEYAASELVFLRILLKSDERMARNPVLAAVAIRLLYVVPGWNFLRLLDLGGHASKTSLLVHIDIQDV